MKSEKIKVGIVGAGLVVENYHLPVLDEIGIIEIKWICDTNINKAKKLANIYNISNFNTDVTKLEYADVVLLAIPVGSRSFYLDYFSNRQINLFIEKPLCESVYEYKSILNLAEKNNTHIGIGLMRRSYHSTLQTSSLFNSMIFGPVKKITASEGGNLRGLNIDKSFYQNDRELSGGGALIETGSHLIDQIFTIFKVNNFEIIDAKTTSNAGLDIDTKISTKVISDVQQDEIELDFRISKIRDVPNKIQVEFYSGNKIAISLTPNSQINILNKNYNKIAELKMENNDHGAKEIYQAFYLEWQDFLQQVKKNQIGIYCSTLNSSYLTVKFIEKTYKRLQNER